MVRCLAALLLLMTLSGAEAGVYRCDQRGGWVWYQDQPCPHGSIQQAQRLVMPPPGEFFQQPPRQDIPPRTPVRVVPLAPDEVRDPSRVVSRH